MHHAGLAGLTVVRIQAGLTVVRIQAGLTVAGLTVVRIQAGLTVAGLTVVRRQDLRRAKYLGVQWGWMVASLLRYV